jgi:hypothetical protein
MVLTMVSSLLAVKGLLMYITAPEGVLLDLPADGEPVHLGHHHVEQHQVERPLAEQLERLGAPAGPGHVEALLLQDGLFQVQDVLVVVDHQDFLGHPRPPRTRAQGDGRILAGSSTACQGPETRSVLNGC